MNRLLRYALLASIAVHVAAGAALYPRPWVPQPRPVIEATLQGSVAAPEMAPVAPQPQEVPAPPTPAIPRPAPRRTAMLAVAAASSPSVPALPVALPEATPSAPAPGVAVAAAAAAPLMFEPPRFNAAYLANPPPPYPASARRRGIEGAVFIDARIGAGGEARELKLATSSGDDALDSAAMDAVREWRFVPARRGEQAVEAWVRIPLVFRLN